MRIADRYELARDLRERYAAADRGERGEILDAFCMTTGYHRKYASGVLGGKQARIAVRRRSSRRRRYGVRFREALTVAWEASGNICSERLQPFLTELVPLLEQHGDLTVDTETRALLWSASISTVERTLAPIRRTTRTRRMSQTEPGTLLRKQIPALVGHWKTEDIPGYLEIDLVSHSGEYAAGTFLYTLSTVDLCTGWTERIPILGKGQAGIVQALERIRQQLPFKLLGLHPDTGSEFINHQLFAYCQDKKIVFTRSRPFHKNDNCHVEQKNWTLVRRLIGYDRLDTPGQLAWLDDFYTNLLRPFANCFQPVMKLIDKEAVEQRVRRKYDIPATPMRRLLNDHADSIDYSRLNALTELYRSTSPLTLKRAIDRALAAMPITLGGRQSASSNFSTVPRVIQPFPPEPPIPPLRLREDFFLTERFTQGQIPCCLTTIPPACGWSPGSSNDPVQRGSCPMGFLSARRRPAIVFVDRDSDPVAAIVNRPKEAPRTLPCRPAMQRIGEVHGCKAVSRSPTLGIGQRLSPLQATIRADP